MIQQRHSWSYTQTKLYFEKIHATPVFMAAQFPRHGNSLNVH